MKARGFTLVELLAALAVLGILAGIDTAVLQAGFDSWNHANIRLQLQQVANEMMEILLEGGYDEDGLKDAVELQDAGLSAVSVVPLWRDRDHTPDPIQNKAQRFILDKQFKAAAATPIGQVRERASDEWVSAPIEFAYGTGRDPKRPDDVVTFTDPIPAGGAIQLLYTPDGEIHPEVQMRFWWNPDEKQIYRSYAGVTKPIVKRMQGVAVSQAAFLYYDNLNRLLPIGQAYTPTQLRRITGVKLYLLLTKADQYKELTSFTNIRNVATIGATITRGTILPLPTPQEIKAMSLGNFAGLQGAGIVEFVVSTDNKPRWKIRLEFKPGASPDRLVLRTFRIESPVGTLRASAILDQAIATEEFVNLLGLDRTGLYDYDDDPDITDAVLVKGERPTLEVTKCDFEVVSLFIRP